MSDILKFHDNPIESSNEDILGRVEFAKHLASAIVNRDQKESLVIAINAEWGAGKSSVINMAVEELDKEGGDGTAKDKTTEANKKAKSRTGKTTKGPKEASNDVAIIRFNPWGFSDDNNLGEHFFAEISNQMGKNKDGGFDSIAKKFKNYGNVFKPLLPIASLFSQIPPDVLIATGKLLKFVDALAKWVIDNNTSIKKSEKELKEELHDELRDSKKKILIIIDDIDRLTTPEIREILRLIRVNGDFPYITYLLAFDRSVVETNLEESPGITGKKYLDKIVQVSFDLPAITSLQISKYLSNELDNIIQSLPKNSQKYFEYGLDGTHWDTLYNNNFKLIFQNIRDVKRFINVLNFNISQIRTADAMAVNPADFIALEVIRLFAPSLYEFVADNRFLFTYLDDNKNILAPNKADNFRGIIDREIEKLPANTSEQFRSLLVNLFPQVNYFDHLYKVNEKVILQWDRDKRICSQKMFFNYFTLSDKDVEFSDAEIIDIFDEEDKYWKIKNNLNGILDERRIESLLAKLEVITSSDNEVNDVIKINRASIIKAFFNIPDDIRGDYRAHNNAVKIIMKLLRQENNMTKVFNIVNESISSSSSLFIPFNVANRIVNTYDPNVLDAFFRKLIPLYFQLVERVGVEKLLESNFASNILEALRRWGQSTLDLQNNLWKQLLRNNANLIKLIEIYSTYSNEKINYINLVSLERVIETKAVKVELERIKKSDSKFYSDNSELIDLYIKQHGQDYRDIPSS